ncbi:hypothetical protein TH63_11550 [Rufibacter radiotolerans]|uniref:Uncharacterized protein n=2 Tax=Rufibacter radiotolerans TaxID=1379910 RepID=A0A0H4VLB3_9BACT|nr:hypothetical protein TH63_11550 [Rufibacter radiotolerans]
MAGMTTLVACDSQTGKTTNPATTDAAQMNNDATVNPPANDTTGASATEKTQTRVGNSQTRGEQNTSNSSTTKNVELKDSL